MNTTSEVKERPILFSGEMVRAILDGRKTQTRRLVKPQPPFGCSYIINGAENAALCFYDVAKAGPHRFWAPPTPTSRDHRLPCPYGEPGDRLWVRETWARCSLCGAANYRADCNKPRQCQGCDESIPKCRPSTHMPRWASRITLEITGVRVERLQDITEDDAKAEGVERVTDAGTPCWKNYRFRTAHPRRAVHVTHEEHCVVAYSGPVPSFRSLWESINGIDSWGANPWVWVIQFRRMEK